MIYYYFEQAKVILFHEPKHAWCIVALLYILGALLLQFFLTAPVKKASRNLSSKNVKAIQRKYIFRSLSGWFFFLISGGLFVLFWYAFYFQFYDLQNNGSFFLVGCIITFLLSVIFHLGAYAASCLNQIKALEDEKLSP